MGVFICVKNCSTHSFSGAERVFAKRQEPRNQAEQTMVLSSTPSKSTQSEDSRALNGTFQPMNFWSQSPVRYRFPVQEVANPTSTVVQPAHAGARLMSVPQISGMQ